MSCVGAAQALKGGGLHQRSFAVYMGHPQVHVLARNLLSEHQSHGAALTGFSAEAQMACIWGALCPYISPDMILSPMCTSTLPSTSSGRPWRCRVAPWRSLQTFSRILQEWWGLQGPLQPRTGPIFSTSAAICTPTH